MKTYEFLEANKKMIIIFRNSVIAGTVNCRIQAMNQNAPETLSELRGNKNMNVPKR